MSDEKQTPQEFTGQGSDELRNQSFSSNGPQLHSNFFRRSLSAVGRMGKRFVREFRPSRKDVPVEALAKSISEHLQSIPGVTEAKVSVGERFGAATLIEFELVPEPDLASGESVILNAMKICWHNPWLAPVVIRPKLQVGEETLDATAAGFTSDTAFAGELYRRFGAPSADKNWRP